MKAIVLVGGLATRLRPLTLNRPKALLPILNIPFIHYQLSLLEDAGIEETILALRHLSAEFKKTLKTYRSVKMKISWVVEKSPLGTGGAIRYAFDHLPKHRQEPVLILNGDILFDIQIGRFQKVFKQSKSDGSLTLIQVKDPTRFGLVQLDRNNKIERFIEKPTIYGKINFVNAGAYILSADLINSIPPGRALSIERDLFPSWLEKGKRLTGHIHRGYWNDIGTPTTYLQSHLDLVQGRKFFTWKNLLRKNGIVQQLTHRPAAANRLIKGPRATIDRDVVIKGTVIVGSGASIKRGSCLENSIIMEGAHLGEDSVVTGCIIGRNCRVGDRAVLKAGTVLGDKSVLTSHSKS